MPPCVLTRLFAAFAISFSLEPITSILFSWKFHVEANAPILAAKFFKNPTACFRVPNVRSNAATFQISLSVDATTFPSFTDRFSFIFSVIISVFIFITLTLTELARDFTVKSSSENLCNLTVFVIHLGTVYFFI
ncbi:MAG: hypothetical protein MAG473_00385 [Thaumarchaeota archaeon]|nr:hypothetical protein [Nitrososphaerota archaeon]